MDQAQACTCFCPVLALPTGPGWPGAPWSAPVWSAWCLCATASPVLPCLLRGRAEGGPVWPVILLNGVLQPLAGGGNGMRAESGRKGNQLGLPVQGDRSGGGLGLPCFVTAASWTVSLCCATSCQLCSSTRKGLLPYLPSLLGGVLQAQPWKWEGTTSVKALEEERG